jgi:tripartite-type tricarboxylate transporter receptor subunit TctC
MFPKKIKFAVATALATSVLVCQAAYPDKPVRLVVPFSAGTSTDILARQFGLALGGIINQPVIVDNKTGAEGMIGAKEVASIAPADGYTALFTSNSTVVLDPFLKASLPYDPVRDLTPVCTVARVATS